MAKDIMHLKLQKALLEEQLKKAELGQTKCIEILLKKKERRMEVSNIDSIPIANLTMARGGVPLSTLRLPKMSVKAYPNEKYSQAAGGGSEKISPSILNNATLLRCKNEHLLRTIGNSEIERRKKEVAILEGKMRKRDQPKKYPKSRIPESFLPRRYELNELPCTIEHGASGHFLSWACPLENLDYEYYLPIFFDGLQVKTEPVCFIAKQGIEDMLTAARAFDPNKVIVCLKSLCRPLRNALSKFDTVIVLNTLKAIQQLCLCNKKIGEALVPFCKLFIGPMSMFLEESRNLGDGIDYGQRRLDDIGDEVRKTLELMEETGGSLALRYIKGSIPLYESCMQQKSRPSTAPQHHSKK